jgi:hypothetical protein
MRFAQCPPHIRKNWQLGVARKQRQEERKLSHSKVAASIAKIKFVFEEDVVYRSKQYCDMNSEEQEMAVKEWREAEDSESQSLTGVPSEEDADIRRRMKDYMTKTLKWTHKELHDAVVIAGISAPETPSMVNLFGALHSQFKDDKSGFLPQNWQSHTKTRIQEVLRCLARTGLKIAGKLLEKKGVLAERLAHWLNNVMEEGRNVPPQKGEGHIGDGDEMMMPRKRNREPSRSRGTPSKCWSSIQAMRPTCHRMLLSHQSKLRAHSVTCRQPTTMPISLKLLMKTRKKKRWHCWAES